MFRERKGKNKREKKLKGMEKKRREGNGKREKRKRKGRTRKKGHSYGNLNKRIIRIECADEGRQGEVWNQRCGKGRGRTLVMRKVSR